MTTTTLRDLDDTTRQPGHIDRRSTGVECAIAQIRAPAFDASGRRQDAIRFRRTGGARTNQQSDQKQNEADYFAHHPLVALSDWFPRQGTMMRMDQAGEMRRRHADIQRQRRVSINPANTCCGAAMSRNIADG